MSYTKGPWKVDINTLTKEHELIIRRDSPNTFEQEMVAKINPFSIPNRDGNAALIAAAPEMFSELKKILDEQLQHGEHGDAELISRLNRIISKIEVG